MCQMSVFVKDGEKEELFQENVTRMEILDKGVRINTLFEGPADISDMRVDHIDFSAGRIVLNKQ